MAVSQYVFNDANGGKFYAASGYFTSTVKDSMEEQVWNNPYYTGWDKDDNFLVSEYTDATNNGVVLYSTVMTTTVKASQITPFGTNDYNRGVSDDANGNLTGNKQLVNKLMIGSGKFTTTIKDSEAVGGVDANTGGASTDDANFNWAGIQADKLYLNSGQITSTIKDSQAWTPTTNRPGAIDFDGTDTAWCDDGTSVKKYKVASGQFTSTIKTSLGYFIPGLVTNYGLGLNDPNARLGAPPAGDVVTLYSLGLLGVGS